MSRPDISVQSIKLVWGSKRAFYSISKKGHVRGLMKRFFLKIVVVVLAEIFTRTKYTQQKSLILDRLLLKAQGER